jgi:hypothetical protein
LDVADSLYQENALSRQPYGDSYPPVHTGDMTSRELQGNDLLYSVFEIPPSVRDKDEPEQLLIITNLQGCMFGAVLTPP